MRRMSSNGVVWWCAFEQETITELGRSVRPHRSCSIGFTPLWGPEKDVVRGKMFGSDDNVIEEVGKWMRVQNSKWYKMRQKLLFLAGARLLRWMEIWRKVRRATHNSSYPTGMFKELHHVTDTKKLCCTPFWATCLSIHLPASTTTKLYNQAHLLMGRYGTEKSCGIFPNLRPLPWPINRKKIPPSGTAKRSASQEGSLSCSQNPATWFCPEVDESGSDHQMLSEKPAVSFHPQGTRPLLLIKRYNLYKSLACFNKNLVALKSPVRRFLVELFFSK